MRNIGRLLTFIVTTILAIAIIGGMLFYVWDEIVVAFQYIDYMYLFPAIIFVFITWLIRGGRYKYIISTVKVPCSLIYSTAALLICQLVNIIIPARLGDFTRVFLFHKSKKLPYIVGISTIVEERLFDVASIALLALFTLFGIYTLLDEWMIHLVFIVMVIGIIGIIFLYLSKYISSNNKLIRKILELIHTIRALSLTPKIAIIVSLLSTLFWLSEAIICYLLSQMFHVEVSFVVVIFAITIANLSKTIPLTPGGIGVYEVILATILSLGGVPISIATIIAVMDHLLINFIPVIGGAMSLYYFGGWAREFFINLLKYGKEYQKKILY